MIQRNVGSVGEKRGGQILFGSFFNHPFQQQSGETNVFAGDNSVGARAHYTNAFTTENRFGHRIDVDHRSDQNARRRPARFHRDRSVSRCQDQTFILDRVGGVLKRRIAVVKTVNNFALSLTSHDRTTTDILVSSTCGLNRRLGKNFFSAVRKRRYDRGRGPQDVDHDDRRILQTIRGSRQQSDIKTGGNSVGHGYGGSSD